MTQNDNGFKSFLSAASIGAFHCVDIDANGKLVASAVSTRPIGVIQEDVVTGNYASVKMLAASGTFMIALGANAVTAGTNYSTLAAGDVGGVVATATLFRALQTQVTASGTIIEFAYVGGAGPTL